MSFTVRSILRRTATVAVTAVAVVAPSTLTAAPAAAADYRTPVASYKIGDPGVLHAGGKWVVLATGSWSTTNTISTATEAAGPWSRVGNALLTRRPGWASSGDHSVWAPSEVRVDGSSGTRYVVFYAAVLAGQASKRCIGTGVSSSPTGPFVPRDKPISCIAGYGAADPEPGTVAADSTIDPTASYVTIDGQRRLYLLYKTQHVAYVDSNGQKHYYSTIRMVRVNIASYATEVLGDSHQLTKRTDNPIEENPVLVQRGATFTLFTSVGGYTTCNYHTEWRQSTHIWSWPATSHRLSFPANTNTCATGDAQVAPGLPDNSWRIFFSGRYPYASSSFKMYVGTVTWSNGTPEVYSILDPA
ncbi:hypothetical protein [Actinocatenispora thailandica]|uniref:hypothetical protein n=1 Tax=Actinocatenispora thailandica TaxID=227318 RepID=UPI0031CF8AE5